MVEQLKKSDSTLMSPVDGLTLTIHSWAPFEGDPEQILVIHPGFGDHAQRYLNLINGLNDNKTLFVAIDARGHGKSEGIRGHANSFSDFSQDLDCLIDHLRSQYSLLPVTLFGHSMGGAVVLDYVQRDGSQNKIHVLVVSAPALKIKLTPANLLKKIIGENLARFFPDLIIAANLDADAISSDESVINDYLEDPLVHDKISLRLGSELLSIGKKIFRDAEKINLPVYLMHGTEDKIALPSGSEELFVKITSAEKKLSLYPKLRHECFNEVPAARNEVLAQLKSWLDTYWN
ncbi:MAG: alpha/beta hydrolase [Bdellovibrionota bacterium]